MRFLVVSDTHGITNKTIQIYNTLQDIDSIIHLGDLKKDADEISKIVNCPVISVEGNCDGNFFTTGKKEFEIFETEFGKMFITHGHRQNVKNSLQSLVYSALEQECKIALFGHTHKAFTATEMGIYLLNPGSISQPLPGQRPSCALLETSSTGVQSSFIYCDEVTTKKASAPKVQGGYLKGLLNHSDRF